MLFITTAVKAQLAVCYNFNVGIATESDSFVPMLMVGDNSFYEASSNASIGVASTPDVMNNNNIGVLGITHSNSIYSFQLNCGALGIVEATNNQHGRGTMGCAE